MRKFTNFGSALVVAAFVAGGMVTFDSSLEAAGSGSSRSNAVLCTLLANSEATVQLLPDSEFKTAALDSIHARQTELGCTP